jgi:hypothetical protein
MRLTTTTTAADESERVMRLTTTTTAADESERVYKACHAAAQGRERILPTGYINQHPPTGIRPPLCLGD